MSLVSWKRGLMAAAGTAVLSAAMPAVAQEPPVQSSNITLDEIIISGAPRSYNNSVVSAPMVKQQTPLTSALAVIDNVPGVSIQEGDTFGFDDWSTTISVRGFQVSLDEQQIGITIDGMPNGNSNYGGGAKANRYIDTLNLGGVEVSQGTADIASRSNEALGGTLNFLTSNPEDEMRIRASASVGQFDAQKYYFRFDTGRILGGTTTAWVSASHQEATDWVNQSAENERQHVAAKFKSEFDSFNLTGYLSYDDTHEDNYQRLFSEADFNNNKEWDQLTAEWTGIPYIDQLYRKGWSTIRKNFFAYLKADAELTEEIKVNAGAYYHKNNGRGDWVPPYLVDVTNNGAAQPQSEFLGGSTVLGGSPLGRIYFVNAAGVQQAPTGGCVSSITFPYGGAGPESDPACHAAGSIAVQSYRHTHYEKERLGFTADIEWERNFGAFTNTLRGGVWYEDATRYEYRDWHKISDTRVGYEFDAQPYWIQYDREYPQDTLKWYIEDKVEFGPVTANFGIKQFLANVERIDIFGDTPNADIESDSDILLSGGLLYETPIEGLSLFGGYAQNFKTLGDEVLERPASALGSIEPETARNIDVGLRFVNDMVAGSVTYYNIKFDNRLIFIDNQSASGPNFLIGTNGSFFNAGGIDSQGVEVAGTVSLTEDLQFYSSYTFNDSTYLGSGSAPIDTELGIVPGNRVVGIAKNLFVASLDWQRGPFNMGISSKYTGDRFVRFDNTWAADGYILTDLYLGVGGEAISDTLTGIDANLVVNNVTDKDYLAGIAGQGAWIGAPRTVVFTVTADF